MLFSENNILKKALVISFILTFEQIVHQYNQYYELTIQSIFLITTPPVAFFGIDR